MNLRWQLSAMARRFQCANANGRTGSGKPVTEIVGMT
jgi:hypothetical protein